MSTPSASDLYLDINNPEYMPRGEVLISALAARNFEVDDFQEERAEGRIYRTTPRRLQNVRLVCTDPYWPSSPNDSQAWSEALRDAGLIGEDLDQAALVAAGALAGLETKIGKAQAATPMTPALAMLQNTRGVVARQSPYNVGAAIERMYSLGGAGLSVEDQSVTAADQWTRAVEGRLEADKLLRVLDEGAKNALLRNFSRKENSSPESGSTRVIASLGPDTPFAWFRLAWDRLNSPAWVEALPARSWTDWATTVIRVGLGFGYLWEIRWYETIARKVLLGGDDLQEVGWEDLLADADREGPLLKWADGAEPVSQRDVAAWLRAKCLTYSALQEEVKTCFADASDDAVGEALSEASRDPNKREHFRRALTQRGTNENCLELVRHMFLKGDELGRYADHYGLLEKVGQRWSVVNPATEWIAVVASLSRDDPNAVNTLDDVAASIKRLGMAPGINELTKHLALAGLARGAPDADGAVLVRSAY